MQKISFSSHWRLFGLSVMAIAIASFALWIGLPCGALLGYCKITISDSGSETSKEKLTFFVPSASYVGHSKHSFVSVISYGKSQDEKQRATVFAGLAGVMFLSQADSMDIEAGPEAIAGLRLFSSRSMREDVLVGDRLITNSPKRTSYTVIICPKPGGNPAALCRMTAAFRNRSTMVVHFPLSQLSRWRELRDAIRLELEDWFDNREKQAAFGHQLKAA